MQGNAARGLPRHDPHRHAQRAPLEVQLDHIAVGQFVLRGQLRANECGVVPSQLRQRLWQFLQPAIIRPGAVADSRVGAKKQFKRRIVGPIWHRLRQKVRAHGKRSLGQRRVFDDTALQRTIPGSVVRE